MTNSFKDLEEADAILIIGSNTSEAHPIGALHIKKALRKGAKLIVVDPRRIDMARRADIHLQLLPGTNVAVVNGLMHVILEEGLADKEFIAARTEGFDELPGVLASYTPELVEALGAGGDELLVGQALFEDHVHEAVDDGHVGTRQQLQMDVGAARHVDAPRVDDDELGALAQGLLDVQRADGVRLARVRADDEDGVGLFEVLE